MTNTYINGCVRGLTQHLRQRCRKREVLLRSSWKHNGRGGTFIGHHRDPTKSCGGHTKVPGQLVGPVNLGLHAHNHEITGRLEPCAISTGEASASGGAAGKQTPLRGNEASQL